MLAAGTRLGPYEVLAPIGAGGMGEVYRARDPRLEREVAVKVLPEDVVGDPTAFARFEREARAVAALSHPNILAIFDFGRDGETAYAVTELLDGKTLRQRMTEGAVPAREMIGIVVQITRGLAVAHEKGIVHRDIKPENLFLTGDGCVKILDFGLARRLPLPGAVQENQPTTPIQTEAGMLVGTIGYMSPEQVMGKSLNACSDLFSLGVVLHEMLSGRRPFQRETAPETIAAVLKEEPPDLAESGKPVPPELERIVKRCLEKRPSDRFQSARDLGFDLETLTTATAAKVVPTRETAPRRWFVSWGLAAAFVVAVAALGLVWGRQRGPKAAPQARPPPKIVALPFENLGPPEDSYFASGMTEEITSRLAAVSGLSVISRASARQYDRTGKTAKDIGKDLGVTHVLDGSVRWERGAGGAGRVRITPQLVRVSDDTQVWAQTFDRVIDDVFLVQSDIAEGVVACLGVALQAETRTALRNRPTANLEAYQAYLRGRYFSGQPHFSEAAWRGAIDNYQRAVDLDPLFVLAWVELSRAHAKLYYLRADLSEERRGLALYALRRAQTLAPASPDAHLAAAFFHFWIERDAAATLEAFEVAARELPGNEEVLDAKAEALRMTGRWQEALEIYRRAHALAPRDASIATELAITSSWLRRFQEALDYSNQAITLAPDSAWPYLAKVFNYWTWDRAPEETRRALASVPSTHEWWLWAWFWQEMIDGKAVEALRRLDASPQVWIRQKMWAAPKSLYAALAHDALHETEAARAAFEDARGLLETEVAKHPDDPRYHSSLGLAYAALGRKDHAIREGLRATLLLPLEKDALYGFSHLHDLGAIYALAGKDDEAFRTLERMLSVPSFASRRWLRAHPAWARISSDPRFEALFSKFQGKS